jgi:phospholipid/cholesterol/gamma-HCH transport system substrate-binding protein
MNRNPIETVMGAIVLLVAMVFLSFAYQTGGIKTVKGYEISAAFTKVGGLTVGSDVRINGIKVGSVLDLRVDPETFNAIVKMSVMPTINLSIDTMTTVSSDGLLGDKYIKLEPGKGAEIIKHGGVLAKTRDPKSIEEIVGDIIFLAVEDTPKSPPAGN